MKDVLFCSVYLLLPFLGSVLGALSVFFPGIISKKNAVKFFLGFAAGVMLACSVWSLLIPSMERAEDMGALFPILHTILGFAAGVLSLELAEKFEGNIKRKRKDRGSAASLLFAITIHNIPEGMAVGVAISEALSSGQNGAYLGAAALSIGIALQNIPEGAVVSMPVAALGEGKKTAFFESVKSGAVEPIFGILTLLFVGAVCPALPFLLAFAAGAMVYAVTREIIPECHADKKSPIATIGLCIGFCLMMAMDTIKL